MLFGEAAIAGLGIAMLPTFIAHEAIRKGELEVVLREHMRPPIGMYAVFLHHKTCLRKNARIH
ncbi:hypothetical protein AK51_25585 [Serratia nematodiphila DZ0503SBS1]|nr:hypothetical protein AK51_25585 [Serratia nematodiphila DZ0503SBS1]